VPESPAQAIERLEMEGATGCLRVDGPAGATARVYFMQGHVFHAEGPAGEGAPALAQALSWWEAASSFDPAATLPTRETIDLSEPEVVALPEEWPDETLPEEEKPIGFANDVSSGQALLVLVGLIVVAVLAILVLSRKY
jgi:hypothetical protein